MKLLFWIAVIAFVSWIMTAPVPKSGTHRGEKPKTPKPRPTLWPDDEGEDED